VGNAEKVRGQGHTVLAVETLWTR